MKTYIVKQNNDLYILHANSKEDAWDKVSKSFFIHWDSEYHIVELVKGKIINVSTFPVTTVKEDRTL